MNTQQTMSKPHDRSVIRANSRGDIYTMTGKMMSYQSPVQIYAHRGLHAMNKRDELSQRPYLTWLQNGKKLQYLEGKSVHITSSIICTYSLSFFLDCRQSLAKLLQK